jgi:hypothetical protein
MASLPVTVKVMVPEVDVADVAAKVTVGAVVSGATHKAPPLREATPTPTRNGYPLLTVALIAQ